MKEKSWRDAPDRLQHINGRVAWAEGYNYALQELMSERALVDLLKEKERKLRQEAHRRADHPESNTRVAAYLTAQAEIFDYAAFTLDKLLTRAGEEHGYQY
jgi:hypothetical protein